MDKKARSMPMTEMLDRLTSFTVEGRQEFTVVYFGNDTLLNKPVEEWPLCEAMIGFFSSGVPPPSSPHTTPARSFFALLQVSR